MTDQDSHSVISRRKLLSRMACVPALAAAASEPRYKLGVMAPKHGSDVVYTPQLSKAERTAMLHRIRDLGVEPFLSLGGFGGDPQTADGLQKYIAQLELCADYEIPVMVGAGPWYYKKFPNIPKREAEW